MIRYRFAQRREKGPMLLYGTEPQQNSAGPVSVRYKLTIQKPYWSDAVTDAVTQYKTATRQL